MDSSNNQKEAAESSQKLQDLIAAMMLKDPPHNYVYPPKPAKNVLLIPTGGLAKCQCSPTCDKELMEPAYRVATKEDIDRMTDADPSNQLVLKMEMKAYGKKVSRKKNSLKVSVVKKNH